MKELKYAAVYSLFGFGVVIHPKDINLQSLLVLLHVAQHDRLSLKKAGIYSKTEK